MKQTVLNLKLPTRMGEEDFFISPSNQDAFQAIETLWLNSFFAFNIYGQKGCGKTHLANIFAQKFGGLIIHAQDINMDNFDTYFDISQILIIEDTEQLSDYEAMFHLYNIYKNEGGYILFTSSAGVIKFRNFILFTSNQPINQITTPIKDLNSRFGALAGVEIKTPDDVLLNALIVKLSFDKGLSINPETIAYILKRAERSFEFIKKLVDELDQISLERKKPVSTLIAKEAINFLEDNLQQELF